MKSGPLGQDLCVAIFLSTLGFLMKSETDGPKPVLLQLLYGPETPGDLVKMQALIPGVADAASLRSQAFNSLYVCSFALIRKPRDNHEWVLTHLPTTRVHLTMGIYIAQKESEYQSTAFA